MIGCTDSNVVNAEGDVREHWPCDFTQRSYRLPTEPEWEKAALGGLSGHHHYCRYTKAAARPKLEQCGFKVVRQQYINM